MISGYIKKIQNHKENDWGRFSIDSLGNDILAVGVIPSASVGMKVVLEGNIVKTKYGKQFQITSVLNTEADEFGGIRMFLSGGYVKRVGLKKANELIAQYGKDCLELFETEEGRAKLAEVKGFGKASIEASMPSYEENKKYIDILMFLNGVGTKAQVEKIYEKYGDTAVKVLKKNPYCLQMDLNGFGFKKTDAIALASGIKKDSIFRVMAGVKEVIESAQSQSGHCYLPMSDIKDSVIPLLVPMPKFEDISEKIAENAIVEWPMNKEKLIKAHDPSAETLKLLAETAEARLLINNALFEAVSQAITDGYLVNEDGNIYTEMMYKTENSVAEMIVSMAKANPVRFIDPKVVESTIKEVEKRKTEELKKIGIDSQFEITSEQREAVFLGLMHKISIISGGPGRGKTAISEIIAKTFLNSGKRYDKKDILMLAPTGKAARRITESTGYDAMTVHRAVMSVKKNGEIPKGKMILVDEASMADIFLMNSILKFAKDCNLILVGDVDQIASVGPGKVLRDLISSEKLPCIILKQGHRNSGTIAQNAEKINAGLKVSQYTLDDHFKHKAFATNEYTQGAEEMADALVKDYIENVKKYGIQNVMLCVAMRERGACCVSRLNKKLQDAFTKGKKEAVFGEQKIFRVGDRVMQTKNDYEFIKVLPNKTQQAGVFNGETGSIYSVEEDLENESYKIAVLFDDGSIGGYTKNTINNLTLAYAITMHKCQGSEAKCVMMAYTYSDYMLLNRSLFYTAETRAKEVFTMYGETQYRYGKVLSALDIAVSKLDDSQRNTMLCERIKALME